MDDFLAITTSFPTVIFTCLFVFCIFYWLVAIMGFVDIEVLDVDIADAANDGISNTGALTGLLMRLGLQGVPFPLTLSLLTIFGWGFSYFTCLFLFPIIPGEILKWLLGVPIFIFAFFAAVFLTARILNPFRSLFITADQQVETKIIGKTARVRSSRVDQGFGEANVLHNGADLIIKVRAFGDSRFERGDKVVLIEHVKEENIYKIISEEEFKLSSS